MFEFFQVAFFLLITVNIAAIVMFLIVMGVIMQGLDNARAALVVTNQKIDALATLVTQIRNQAGDSDADVQTLADGITAANTRIDGILNPQ